MSAALGLGGWEAGRKGNGKRCKGSSGPSQQVAGWAQDSAVAVLLSGVKGSTRQFQMIYEGRL